MVVENKEIDPQAQKDLLAENKDVEDRKRDAANAVISTLNLPLTDEEKGKEAKKEPKKEEEPAKKEDKKESEVEEFESDKTDDEILKAKDEDLTEKELTYKKQLKSDDGNEELIPKSKFEKTINKMQKRIDDLTAKTHKEEPSNTDSDTARLEKMSLDKLDMHKQAVKTEIRALTRGLAKGEEVDEKRLDDLEVLSDKIDESVKTYPTRFRKTQIKLFNEVGDEISNDSEIENLEEAVPEIKKLAESIYAQYPKLQGSEEGQAMALRLAADHWKIKKSFSVGKERVDATGKTLKRLKRKTTLDSNILKGEKGKTKLTDLRKKAGRGGTDEDRKNFVKADGMFGVDDLIPDEFKER